MKNYYEILGVDITATQEEIRKAYYKQARKYHPDNNPRQDTTNMMQQITLAYNTLSNEESKKQYDATLKRNQSRTSFNNTTTNTNNSTSNNTTNTNTTSNTITNNTSNNTVNNATNNTSR